ncbi:UNVERIFIED_CONTAM: hypothetical protein GTU68_050599, partial [Idotea baltica]|nr:hypothetical protein [Idotea baltica]
TYTAEADVFREKIQAFLAEHLPSNWKGIGALDNEASLTFTREWRDILRDNQLLAATWPTEYGGAGLSALESVIMAEEFQKAGVPTGGTNDAFSIQMVGNTIIHWGTEEQKKHFLPRIISGEDIWCQGYSEPNAGSDLGNLGCRATLDGDEWSINGQKIWTSAGHMANWIFVLTRTEADVAKHRGITFLLCPMDQEGVEVRPIEMISGESDFNEVFFTEAKTAKENVIGEVNGGWAVAMTLLGFERGEAAATTPVSFRGELDRLTALAKSYGRTDDPVVRQQLAWCIRRSKIMRYPRHANPTQVLSGRAGQTPRSSALTGPEYHKTSRSCR